MPERGCFKAGWIFRRVWMKPTRPCYMPSAVGATGSGVARLAAAIGLDASMAQPGGAGLGDVVGMAPRLRLSLLAWWTLHGRAGIPWKRLPSGVSPSPAQHLDPYGIWIAEVMLCSAA